MEQKKFWLLIVEDDPTQAKICARYLQQFDDRFVIASVDTGQAALERLAEQQQQGFAGREPVILLDYELPDISCLELLTKIFSLRSDLIVIVVTAHEERAVINQVLSAGAIDYLFKTPDYFHHLPRLIEINHERWMVRREHEQMLARAQQRDAELAAALARLENTQLQLVQSEKMLAIRQLISGLTHELNNSLTSIVGFTQLLLNQQPDQRHLKIIEQEGRHAHDIIRKLLSFARQDKPTRHWFDFNLMIQRVVDLRAYQLKVNNIALELSLRAQPPLFFGDEEQLQQVFLNLIINAEMALANLTSAKKLQIASETRDGRLLVSVKDNGPGVPADLIGKIFDPFFTTRPHGEGAGLGLSVCYGIVQEHNGLIEVINDGGACFTIALPLVIPASPANTIPPPAQPAQHQPITILIADDEEAIRLLLSECFKQEGFRIDTATDGREAWQKIGQQDYQAILIDCRMPGLDAIEIYHRLQQSQPALLPRLIFMTGDIANPKIVNFLHGISNPHIVKPFNIDEVLVKLKSVIKSSEAEDQQ